MTDSPPNKRKKVNHHDKEKGPGKWKKPHGSNEEGGKPKEMRCFGCNEVGHPVYKCPKNLSKQEVFNI